MKYDKYYDNLIIDQKINPRFVTYLSTVHIINTLVKRDRITNKPLKDIGRNYAQKFIDMYNEIDSSLSFVNDDILNIFNFTYPHIEKIFNNPHKKIIKDTKLIEKNKLKTIEPKTMVWLSSKAGSSIREKLANVSKVSSTIKRYSNNVKENQVMISYCQKMHRLLNEKINFMHEHSYLFGNYKENKKYLDLCKKMHKIRNTIKENFDEVIAKEHVAPNNALIDNVDYASIWKSYTDIKHDSIDYSNSFNDYKHILKISFVLYMMNFYEYIENNELINDIDHYILYRKDENYIEELKIGDDFNINQSIYSISEGKCKLIEKSIAQITIRENEVESTSGVPFTLSLNDKDIYTGFADLINIKKAIMEIINTLNITLFEQNRVTLIPSRETLISINSYDNMGYGENNLLGHVVNQENMFFVPNSIYTLEKENIYFNTYDSMDYGEVLSQNLLNIDVSKNDIIIYDINDNYDQFSSTRLRKTYSSIFYKSYPVWRSILAAESLDYNNDIKYVVDLCGNDFSITCLGHKNGLLIHSEIEKPSYFIQSIAKTETDIYNDYLIEYSKKYNFRIDEKIKEDIINSGALNKLLTNKKGEYIVYNDNVYICIRFDEEIFKDVIKQMDNCITKMMITDYNIASTCYIVPNFYTNTVNNIIHNNQLTKGAEIIIERVRNKKVTWFEKLPNLSLEIIKNGMYDFLNIVNDRECENIIGQKIILPVEDKFVLKKGEKNYILPLNKSFIGEHNKSFIARVEHPCFPLKEDVEVELKIIYSFENENSYRLIFEPVNSGAPFENIEVIWEEEKPTFGKLKYPQILDISFDEESLQKAKDQISSKVHFFTVDSNRHFDPRFIKRKVHLPFDNTFNEVMRKVSYITNIQQRLDFYEDQSTAKETRKILEDYNFIETVKRIHEDLSSSRYVEDKPNSIRYDYEELEQCMVEITQDRTLLLENKLKCPYACFGRYLAYDRNDEEVIELAYRNLIELTSDGVSANNYKLIKYLDRLTGGSAVNHLFIKELADTSPTYCLSLLNIIVDVLKEISTIDYDIVSFAGLYQTKEYMYCVRTCIELLIAFLYCRDKIEFKKLRPNGKLAKEIVYVLKLFIKKFDYLEKNITDEKTLKKLPLALKTKYHFEVNNKPDDLYNTWDAAYCLIQYLTNSDLANYIIIKKVN